MRYLYNLIRNMLPIQVMLLDEQNFVPEGFARVITNTGAFVTTAYNTRVIAKDYV